MRTSSWMFSVAALLAACAVNSPPVPVRGEMARLEGRWVGEYENVMLGRSGSIDFLLGPGVDTAQGSVLMVPAGGYQRVWGTRAPGPDGVLPSPQLLQILMVRVDGTRVSGRLAAYRDPESGEMVSTSFIGYLTDNAIDGKFFTVGENSEWAVEGRWHVVRQHSPR